MALALFTVFHLNDAFSSVPPGDFGRVLDRCLWPLVDATATPGVRLGLEMPADTLARVAATDASLLAAIGSACDAGRLELVGSGLVQAILPLVPAAIGARNLFRGRERYAELLGRVPRIAYLHEQTYAAGLVPLYRDAGYDALVAEWENPASAHRWPVEARYRAVWIEGTGGVRLPCLWNSSMVFQRVQRHAHGDLSLDEFLADLLAHDEPGETRVLCLYGNDVEVFDYRPGEGGLAYGGGVRGEWERLGRLLATVAADPRCVLVTPSEALARRPPEEPALHLESAAAPLPTKKQVKYNVVRWAACGRENVRLNARCHALARRLDLARALTRATGGRVAEPVLARAGDEVVRLWGSDLRTRATDERVAAAAVRLGVLDAELGAVVGGLERSVLEGPLAADEVALFNPHPHAWAGWPMAIRLAWPPGLLRGTPRVETAEGRAVPAQLEEVEVYRDGSLRAALLVLAPGVLPLATLRLHLRSGPAVPAAMPGRESPERIETAAVCVELAPRRGGTVRTLGFPRLAPQPLAGTIRFGTFTPIELAADWYSGGLVLFDAAGVKHTDLEPTALRLLAAPEACPIRVPVLARLAGPYGELWKTIWVYRDTPRVDLRYHLVLRDQRPRQLRLGVLTLDPTAFDGAQLRYATVNGGRDVETFGLAGTRVAQHEPASETVSARGCLGATEGWVDVGDAEKGVTVAYDPTALAAAPLVQHEPVGERALTRVFLSLGETDETAAPFWRGHTRFTVSWLGRGADLEQARRQALAAAHPLHVVRPETLA